MAGQPGPGTVNNVLVFDVTGMEIREQNPVAGALQEPQFIIPVTSDFVADVSFEISGLLANTVTCIAMPPPPYEVSVHAESIGVGQEGEIGSATGNLVCGQLDYTQSVTIPAGTLDIGVYKLVAVVKFTGTTPPLPMIGFTDNPIMIQIKERLW